MEKLISEASDTMDHLSLHHVEWKLKMKQARMALRTAITDALLTAGYVIYCGPLDQLLRNNLLADWLTRCETTDFISETADGGSSLLPVSSSRQLLVPNENYSVEEVIGIAELLPELETAGMLLDSGSRHNAALIYSCLFCRSLLQRWTLVIDPDNQAESCVRYLLERASTTSRAFSNGELICSFATVIMYANYVVYCISTWKKCNVGSTIIVLQ